MSRGEPVISYRLCCMLFIMACGFSCVSDEVLKVRGMHINHVDTDTIKDGVHRGTFTYSSFTYEVWTGVKNKRIESVIIIRNRNTKYARMAEEVVDRILQKQSPDVDAVTGATTTSKALMKAVENSLLNAR